MYAVDMSQQTYEVSGESPLPHLNSFLTIQHFVAPRCLCASAAGDNSSNVCCWFKILLQRLHNAYLTFQTIICVCHAMQSSRPSVFLVAGCTYDARHAAAYQRFGRL